MKPNLTSILTTTAFLSIATAFIMFFLGKYIPYSLECLRITVIAGLISIAWLKTITIK